MRMMAPLPPLTSPHPIHSACQPRVSTAVGGERRHCLGVAEARTAGEWPGTSGLEPSCHVHSENLRSVLSLGWPRRHAVTTVWGR